ncbi:hypothetical protein Pfo_015397 [Paulownia fortunei]|nr:hypothetical protein Pfo_015397 [Paulownia fortunei]
MVVLTNHLLKQVLSNPETSGRLVKWAIELSEHGIEFCPRPAIKAQGDKFEYALKFEFLTSNNEAEYEALLAGVRKLAIYNDFQLVVNQVREEYKARDEKIIKYLSLTHDMLAKLKDSMASINTRKITFLSTSHNEIDGICLQILCADKEEPSWKDNIVQYLTTAELPDNPVDARKLKTRAARFLIIDGELYKRGFSQPYLKCLTLTKANYVLCEIHEGICGNHLGGKSLAAKALRQGYFWPTIQNDARELAYRTTPRVAIRESPFNLTFGIEAIVPTEIEKPSWRMMNYAPQHNDIALRVNLDLIEELREKVASRSEMYKARMARAYNMKVHSRSFQVGDLVLRKVEVSHLIEKLDPKWQGPYKVVEIVNAAAYRLQRMDGKDVPRTWNVINLKKFYT